MSVTTTTHGTSTSIAITSLNSLGIDGWASSAPITGSTDVDALVVLTFSPGAVTSDGTVAVYAYASADGGTTHTAGVPATDATITWGTSGTTSVNGQNNLPLLGVGDVDDTDDANVITIGPFSVAAAFGGILPERWGIIVHNDTDAAADASGHSAHYRGITYTST